MKTRERFDKCFHFQPVDRPLLYYDGEPQVNDRLGRYLGVTDLAGILEALRVDFRTLFPEYIGPELPIGPDGRERDIWGIERKPVRNPTGSYMEVVNQPWGDLKTLDDVERYPWPQASWYDFSHFPERCQRHRDSIILFGRPGLMDLINGVSFGRGYDNVLCDLAERNQIALALFQRRFDFMYEYARKGLQAAKGAIDILFFGEDLGTQQGLLIPPKVWEQVLAPFAIKMISLAHEFGAKAMMHSCGSVFELIPRFIEIGLDVLQAVQPKAKSMSPEFLARRFGGTLVFNGTMDIQETLPLSTADQVRQEVRNRKEAFRNCGGFILGPCHKIQTDTPVENIIAMYEEGSV